VALLHILSVLRDEFGLRLEVVHLQHGIRGEEARQDAQFVAGMAAKLELPFHLKEVNLPGVRAARGKGNLEEMAREERRRFFAAVAEEQGIRKLAIGHTRDDQVETILMWLLRGSGRKGLGGMAPVSTPAGAEKGPMLIRPLLESSREEVISYLAAETLGYRMDRTNLDPKLLRNWIRLELLPRLRVRTDAHLDERLARLAEMMRDEEEFLAPLTVDLLPEVTQAGNLLRGALLAQSKAMQRRLVRLWLEATLGSLRGVDFLHVEEILRLISEGPPQSRLSVPRGWDLVKQYETVRLERRRRKQKARCYRYDLPIEGELYIPEAGVKMESSRDRLIPGALPRNNLEALFDLDSLPQRLTVRNFRPGDRFQPLGMQGHKKVKDLFIEKKVPLEARSTLPLLLAGEEILWIPRYGRSEIAKIGPATKEVLRVKLSAVGHQPHSLTEN
jgi:tRNA(Ile)-lysidine synthase